MTSAAANLSELQTTINHGWELRETGLRESEMRAPQTPDPDVRQAVDTVISLLDSGILRVASPVTSSGTSSGTTSGASGWEVHQWVKKAILLSFQLYPLALMPGGTGPNGVWWDKIPSKFSRFREEDFAKAGFRAVPGSIVRRGAYIAPHAVLMPSFVNIGAHVGEASMIDTWAAVGSGAQIGRRVHISGGAGIGGVLEPLQASPVIIEDDCFIGARSEVAEGVIVEQGSVLSMGVYLGQSTKIIDRQSGEVFFGRVPAGSVVVPGSLPSATPGRPSLYCAVIIKRVDAKTRAKTSINALLRDA